ncbi:MAG TPA: GNAT family N-acetyltransferase [Gaiellaceae bacterium]
MSSQPGVVHNPAANRYELRLGSELVGVLDYLDRDGSRVLVHTEIEEARREHGYGTALVAGAVEDVRESGLRVVPLCPFVQDYLARGEER